ncbi:MAG: amidohydrolase family protein [Armatimonadota bacterium]|nr:MAG: amidohydrolase family protein [Armatimonadota bacterium]
MAIDVHIHTHGTEDGVKVLEAMDRVGLERAVLLGVPPHLSGEAAKSERPHTAVIDTLAKLVKADPERLLGFAWIEPTLPDAQQAVDYALDKQGLRGVKMIPNKWYPADERAQACYAKINEYGRPMLFHTGILWGTSDTSQYCRPAFYEIMFHYPRIRFAMAHMSWPWTDECMAVMAKFKANQTGEWTSYIEITSGAPPMWKVDALRKALGYLGDEHIMFGSDARLPEGAEYAAWRLREDEEMLREAGASGETIERVLSTNALTWLGIQ